MGPCQVVGVVRCGFNVIAVVIMQCLLIHTVHPACSVQKSPIFTILLFSFADRKEVKLQL